MSLLNINQNIFPEYEYLSILKLCTNFLKNSPNAAGPGMAVTILIEKIRSFDNNK